MSTTTPFTTDPRDSFIAATATFVNLEDAARQFLYERTRISRFAKNSIPLHSEHSINYLYVVHSGLARGYQFAGEDQITTSFFKPFSFIYSPHSFLNQSPARESVEMLENSVLVGLPYTDLLQLYQHAPGTSDLGFRIANNYASIFDERLLAMRSLDGVQLYQWFLNRHPDLYGRVSNKKLASFLGMSHENLSRIQTGRIRVNS